jgi:hypothetical protein
LLIAKRKKTSLIVDFQLLCGIPFAVTVLSLTCGSAACREDRDKLACFVQDVRQSARFDDLGFAKKFQPITGLVGLLRTDTCF